MEQPMPWECYQVIYFMQHILKLLELLYRMLIFVLGAHSTLEYRLSSSAFENAGKWEETGDVAQMTPFGFIITGRKKTLFCNVRRNCCFACTLRATLKEDDIISDACVIGDKMPYLSALIVLNHNALADYRVTPEKIKDHVQAIVNKVNESLPRNVTLKKVSHFR